jgi:putative transposase
MSRQLRIQEAGLVYHVFARGNGRMTIYLDDADRLDFLDVLADTVETHALVCHAYCLMPTHYHLVVSTLRANVSRAIQQLNRRYAQRWNRRHGHVGHVFQGRFGAQIVQEERHFLTVCRYVLRNPVRAALVRSAADWPWSSLRATLNEVVAPSFLDTRLLLSHFTPAHGGSAVSSFAAFVSASTEDDCAPARHRVLGDEAFVERFTEPARQAGLEVPRHERSLHRSLDDLFRHAHTRAARDVAMARAHVAGFTLAAIGRYLELHPSTVSAIVRRERRIPDGVRSSKTCGVEM